MVDVIFPLNLLKKPPCNESISAVSSIVGTTWILHNCIPFPCLSVIILIPFFSDFSGFQHLIILRKTQPLPFYAFMKAQILYISCFHEFDLVK